MGTTYVHKQAEWLERVERKKSHKPNSRASGAIFQPIIGIGFFALPPISSVMLLQLPKLLALPVHINKSQDVQTYRTNTIQHSSAQASFLTNYIKKGSRRAK